MSKFFERAIYTHLVDFANRNSLLSQVQFGFRAGMKTVEAIVKVTEFFLFIARQKISYALGLSVDLRKVLKQNIP